MRMRRGLSMWLSFAAALLVADALSDKDPQKALLVDYKKKYDYLNVEHQNLKGRYENMQTEKQAMADRISQDQQTIDELKRQIEKKKAAQIT